MEKRKFRLHDGKRGAALTVRVVPRARATELQEILPDGTLKIRIAATPTEGKANTLLIEFLSKIFHVHKSDIEIVAGAGCRDKLISITGVDTITAQKRIIEHQKKSD
jgi:hypothetical protein